jgi:hypothetical protein
VSVTLNISVNGGPSTPHTFVTGAGGVVKLCPSSSYVNCHGAARCGDSTTSRRRTILGPCGARAAGRRAAGPDRCADERFGHGRGRSPARPDGLANGDPARGDGDRRRSCDCPADDPSALSDAGSYRFAKRQRDTNGDNYADADQYPIHDSHADADDGRDRYADKDTYANPDEDAHANPDGYDERDRYADEDAYANSHEDAHANPHEDADEYADEYADLDFDADEYADQYADADEYADQYADADKYADMDSNLDADVDKHADEYADLDTDRHTGDHSHADRHAASARRFADQISLAVARYGRKYDSLYDHGF